MLRRSEPISLEMPVETPECVRMTYRLAGPAARIGAYLLDTLLRGAIMVIVGIVLMCAGFTFLGTGMSVGLFLLISFFVEWGYFAISEGFYGGRTLGKKAMGIRVIEKYGYPLSFWAAMMRNLLRAADGLGFYGFGFISMLCTRRFQRLGDLAAGTIVIHEKEVRLPTEPIILETIKPLNRSDIGSFVPSERTLTLIDHLLSRRNNSHQRVPHERGHDIARELALVLAQKLDYQADLDQVKNYSMAFLARVYVTFLRQKEDDTPVHSGTADMFAGVES
ncbi:MAG TPA: RDD family protein [Planctomycetaceae bacterium]|nr:RDD family protein [Planctomycetaceae bacterium]